MAGERWKESSESSPFVSMMEGSLGSCKTVNKTSNIGKHSLENWEFKVPTKIYPNVTTSAFILQLDSNYWVIKI